MTLKEATSLTFEPVREIFNKAIDVLDNEEEFNKQMELLDSIGLSTHEMDERLDAKVAFYALENPPDHKSFETALANITRNNKGNINELMSYRQNVPQIIHYIEELELQIYGWKYIAEIFLDSTDRTNKRWEKKEDDELIEMACMNIPEIAMAVKLKRNPSAIKTRISYLVGVKRLTQKVAGKFIGEIDGVETESTIKGTVYKR